MRQPNPSGGIMADNKLKKSSGLFSYNSPVILTFTIFAVIVQLLSTIPVLNWTHNLFVTGPGSLLNPLYYLRLFTHVIGHGSWSHLIGNFTFILLVGPMLEEKYGSKKLLFMMAITAVATALINNIIFSNGLCGASGIVFMFILLASCTTSNKNDKKIPITLILAAVFYLGQEVINSFKPDNISQLAHIIGGICGAGFGLYFAKSGKSKDNKEIEGSKETSLEDKI